MWPRAGSGAERQLFENRSPGDGQSSGESRASQSRTRPGLGFGAQRSGLRGGLSAPGQDRLAGNGLAGLGDSRLAMCGRQAGELHCSTATSKGLSFLFHTL